MGEVEVATGHILEDALSHLRRGVHQVDLQQAGLQICLLGLVILQHIQGRLLLMSCVGKPMCHVESVHVARQRLSPN